MVGSLTKELDGVMESDPASRVMAAREVLYRRLKAKHEICRVRAKLRAVGKKGASVVGWVRHVDSQKRREKLLSSL